MSDTSNKISIGLPISKLTPIQSLNKDDLIVVSEHDAEDIYSTKRATVDQIRCAISGDIYNYTINNLTTVSGDIAYLSTSISSITDRIPQQTYEEGNELADKNFVNSSIQTNTAEFKGTFNLSTELPTEGVNNNDYAFVTDKDEVGNISAYNRYKYTQSLSSWLWEYKLNSSGFTSDQWNSINSGITKELVEHIPQPGSYITTNQPDGKTIKLEDNILSVGSIVKSQISDLPEIPSVQTVENKVSKDSLTSTKWKFYLKDGTEMSYNVVLSVG